ncbi:hypothetical protein P389DRAFT_208474 [Cystobasidium minutum MCA 4210]|uniref:uncharacterized protein n=1 Tax=Cystobasidium minutum MCA 4210 TaxID=1397322 RepID=UPI0034CF435C|eukprot:jgi/Rhomi1/208474/estExt_Genemark1.C_2_t10147
MAATYSQTRNDKGSNYINGDASHTTTSPRHRAATLGTCIVIALVLFCNSLRVLDAARLQSIWVAVKSRASSSSSCPWTLSEAVPYPNAIPPTALASFPRSGSSYTRSLVERATVKTHFPATNNADLDPSVEHWKHFSRAVRIVRNPFDSIWSAYHFTRTGNHSARLRGVSALSIERDLAFLERWTKDWAEHGRYWLEKADIPAHTIRYEDLRLRSLATLTGLVDFLMPPAKRPSEKRLRCAAIDDPSKDPYWSRKSPPFAAWDNYDTITRRWILEAVKDIW